MSQKVFVFSSFIFAILIIASNYLVQFNINEYLTYGALSYPITFLLSNILSEKYNKDSVLKMVRIGMLLAFIPSYFLAEPKIAIASIIAFFIVQQVDVYLFYFLKSYSQKTWWLRNAGSSGFSLALDTFIFFSIAFYGEIPIEAITKLMLGDFAIKIIVVLVNIPIFYQLAIKNKSKGK